jgi:hypothetical protein
VTRYGGYLYKMYSETLQPADALKILPALSGTRNPNVWVYRYTDEARGWTLSVATHAAPGSGQLSLGGFRIAPVERTASPGFTTDHEAIGLAMGMEEKVHWSRVIRVGGPLAQRDFSRIVGGKCVLAPTPDARVGQPLDFQLLDFAIACFQDIEQKAGIHLTTGQDLGHGLMSDGRTQSLAYLNARFTGSVVADTSIPTGEGNHQILKGMLRGLGIDIATATVGLIGCGNIGMHLLGRLREHGTTILALESRDSRRAEIEAMGIKTWAPADKSAFLALPMDAVVVNAAGGTLDAPTIETIAHNARLRIVCGSENLVMPDASGAASLQQAGKVYAPTELGGMMGYLTAVEEYLSKIEKVPFDVTSLLVAAERLDTAGFEATCEVMRRDFKISFEDEVTALYAK